MWKLMFPAIAVLTILLIVPGPASAKGNEATIIVGGGNLAPYYYAIPGTPPIQGWLGLLANEGDQPTGRIADPPDSAVLLAASYDIYFDDEWEQGAPHASYVPGAAAHPAYLYWRAATGGMPYRAWFTLTDPARAYLDDAIKTAAAMKDVGSSDLETDWLASAVRHGRYFTGLEGTSSIISNEYVITESARYTNGAAAPLYVTGDDAPRLLDAYITTLHNWYPITYDAAGDYHAFPPGSGKSWEYSVFTPEGRQVFSIEVAPDGSIMRVYAAEGFSGYFDAAPGLETIMKRVIPLPAASSKASAASTHEASRSAGIVAGALAASLLLALGIGAAWAHRSEPSVSD
jgi:hypothetical protein